jgi:hypothetical protein
MIIEFTEFQRPYRLASITRLGSMDIGYKLTFEPTADGTRMRWSGDLRPRGPLMRFKPVLLDLAASRAVGPAGFGVPS